MALERHVRSAQQRHCRLLQLSDNLVSVLAFDKGRSKSWALNVLCRRVCALVVVCDIVWRLCHIRSEKNVSDEGARKDKYRSPLMIISEKLFLPRAPLQAVTPVPVPCKPLRVCPATPKACWQADDVSAPPPELPVPPCRMEQEPCLQIDEVPPPPPEAPVAVFPCEPSALPPVGASVPVQPVTQKPQQLDQQPQPKTKPAASCTR